MFLIIVELITFLSKAILKYIYIILSKLTKFKLRIHAYMNTCIHAYMHTYTITNKIDVILVYVNHEHSTILVLIAKMQL